VLELADKITVIVKKKVIVLVDRRSDILVFVAVYCEPELLVRDLLAEFEFAIYGEVFHTPWHFVLIREIVELDIFINSGKLILRRREDRNIKPDVYGLWKGFIEFDCKRCIPVHFGGHEIIYMKIGDLESRFHYRPVCQCVGGKNTDLVLDVAHVVEQSETHHLLGIHGLTGTVVDHDGRTYFVYRFGIFIEKECNGQGYDYGDHE
jgi:hypothetical protein